MKNKRKSIITKLEESMNINEKQCDNCDELFQEGFTIEETNYYCSEECMDNHGVMSYADFLTKELLKGESNDG